MESPRVNLGKAAPELYQALAKLEEAASKFAAGAGIAQGLAHLLRLRASQINQCSYCVRMHARDALASGESSDRVNVVAAWRDTHYFTDQERAALQLVEAVTNVAAGQVPESAYAEAAAALPQEQIAAVEWLAVVINAWNRVAISSRYPVKP